LLSAGGLASIFRVSATMRGQDGIILERLGNHEVPPPEIELDSVDIELLATSVKISMRWL